MESTVVSLSRTSGHKAELVGTFLPTFYFRCLWQAKEECGGLGYSSKPATDTLSARVAVVPGRRAADLGTLRDPNQARSLGRQHWPSKQGVSARSIGQASKESWPEALAEQARSLDRIHRLSNEQELGFGSFLFQIFSSYQVQIQ